VGYGEGELDLGRWRGQREGNREGDKKGKGINDGDLAGDARTLGLDTTPRVGKSGSLREDREGQGLGRESSGVQQGPNTRYRFPGTFIRERFPLPGSSSAPIFDGYDASDFLEQWTDACDDYELSTEERRKRFPRYCITAVKDKIVVLPE